MSIYDPIHAYDLRQLSASRDVLTRQPGRTDEQYAWVGIGKPLRDPNDSMVWVCHVACTWLSLNTMVVTGRDGFDALRAAFELVERAVQLHRRSGNEILFRDHAQRGPQWIVDRADDLLIDPAIFEKLIAAAGSAPVPRLHSKGSRE